MKTLNVTLPTNKAGKLAIFTISFSLAQFDAVIDAVSQIKSFDELNNNNLWKVV